MGGIIIPKNYVTGIEKPLIFLAGPIRSASDWQSAAAEIILSADKELYVVSPRREVSKKMADYVIYGDNTHFHRQRAWENHYLEFAARRGSTMFWLPGEHTHDCKKVYGAMTRVELGQIMTHYKYDDSREFCVGSDGLFPEIDTIAYDLSVYAPEKAIRGTLEKTCAEAILLARLKSTKTV